MKQYEKSNRTNEMGNYLKNGKLRKSLLTMFICLLAFNFYGQTWQIGSPNATDITATLNNDTLTITGTGTMQDWYYNNTSLPWHNVLSEITNVIIHSGVTTIGKYAFLDCTAYPNPVKDELTIERDDPNIENEIVQIIDYLGRTVINTQFQSSNTQLIINVSHLPAGTYIVKIGNYRSKFIKE